MMFHILLTCSLTLVLVHGQRYLKSIPSQPRVDYSSSVVHTYPGTNDLLSESSIKVNFQPQQEVSLQNSRTRGTRKYVQSISNAPSSSFNSRPSFSTPQTSNSFSVGYNISFSDNDDTRRKKQRFTSANNKKIENAEVITGRIKKNEKVRAPSISTDLSPQDFVAHAFLKHKQLTSENTRHAASLTGTHGKYLNPVREQVSNFPSQSSKFTYNTQQNIFSDVVQATKPDPIQLAQEFKTSYQTNNRWKNVGPGLEVSKSIEPQIPNHSHRNTYTSSYSNSKTTREEKPENFNHDSALKNSLAFDFSNAHGEISYGDNAHLDDNSSEGSEQYSQRTKSYDEYSGNGQKNFDIDNINVNAHIPAQLRGVKPLPLDTSLLKDPVLTTDFKEIPKDSRQIPIRFDISSIQTVMQEQLANIQNYAEQSNAYSNQQPQNYGQVPQLNNNQLPKSTYRAGSSYDDHEQSASQTDFRVYGKPESVDANQHRTGYNFNKKHVTFDNDMYKIVSMRPPPIGQNVKY